MSFDPSSRARLTPGSLARFDGASLFDKVARVMCDLSVLPRKELYEAWEVARRTRRHFRGGRVLDLACGHGLLGGLMLLLDATSDRAVCVDRALPKSAEKVRDALVREWPRLEGRIELVRGDVADVDVHAGDVLVSAHACGALTDVVLSRAIAARARVAVLPCCHDVTLSDGGGVGGWLDAALAIDVTRAARLRHEGYEVRSQLIPAEITPKNRLLLGEPRAEEWSARSPRV